MISPGKLVQYLGKYRSAGQQLACRGWHRVNRQEELVMEEGGEAELKGHQQQETEGKL